MTDVPSASHTSHWGAYTAQVATTSVVGVEPHPDDPLPSPLLGNIVVRQRPRARVAQPAIRRGLARGRAGPDRRRGADEFVEVELGGGARPHGGRARAASSASTATRPIFGGSYGWASAGRFHHAQSQLHRFLDLLGGYTASGNTYSLGAADVILPPRRRRRATRCWRGATSWDVDRASTPS